jgi:uncharacterized protein
MNRSLLNKLACPFDKTDLLLHIHKQQDDDILEGVFICTECQRYYPIVHGIPIFSPDEYRESRFEQPLLERWGLKLENEDKRPGFRILLPEGK